MYFQHPRFLLLCGIHSHFFRRDLTRCCRFGTIRKLNLTQWSCCSKAPSYLLQKKNVILKSLLIQLFKAESFEKKIVTPFSIIHVTLKGLQKKNCSNTPIPPPPDCWAYPVNCAIPAPKFHNAPSPFPASGIQLQRSQHEVSNVSMAFCFWKLTWCHTDLQLKSMHLNVCVCIYIIGSLNDLKFHTSLYTKNYKHTTGQCHWFAANEPKDAERLSHSNVRQASHRQFAVKLS